MSKVHRWEAVHLKDGDSNIRYQDGTGPDMVKASDYDQLKAENERLNESLRVEFSALRQQEAEIHALREQLNEAREVIKEMRYACTDKSEVMADAWLEACDGVDDFMQVWPEGTK